jgi:16S rRNA (guanine966-N2)-methyltransferase
VLDRIEGVFDIVFLDPPWQKWHLSEAVLSTLVAQDKLAPDALVYLERPGHAAEPMLLPGWQVVKETRAGEVCAILLERA